MIWLKHVKSWVFFLFFGWQYRLYSINVNAMNSIKFNKKTFMRFWIHLAMSFTVCCRVMFWPLFWQLMQSLICTVNPCHIQDFQESKHFLIKTVSIWTVMLNWVGYKSSWHVFLRFCLMICVLTWQKTMISIWRGSVQYQSIKMCQKQNYPPKTNLVCYFETFPCQRPWPVCFLWFAALWIKISLFYFPPSPPTTSCTVSRFQLALGHDRPPMAGNCCRCVFMDQWC